jgi:hypothetical protein
MLSRFLPASPCPRLSAARQRSLLAGPIGAVRSISPGRGLRPLHGCPLFVFDDGTGSVRDHACSLLHLVSLRRDYIETPAGKREISPAISDGQPEKSGIALLNRHRCFLPPIRSVYPGCPWMAGTGREILSLPAPLPGKALCPARRKLPPYPIKHNAFHVFWPFRAVFPRGPLPEPRAGRNPCDPLQALFFCLQGRFFCAKQAPEIRMVSIRVGLFAHFFILKTGLRTLLAPSRLPYARNSDIP